jgi:hypothetical protein
MNREPREESALRGFRCAYCGRPLEERSAWRLKTERFYCSTLCSEADEHDLPFAPTGTGWG